MPYAEYNHIWEKGIGFDEAVMHSSEHDRNRVELLRLLLTLYSEAFYQCGSSGDMIITNKIKLMDNKIALTLFASLLNTVCAYNPVSSLPYNHLLWTDSKELLVELALQVRSIYLLN